MSKGRVLTAAALILLMAVSVAVIVIRSNMTLTNKTARIYQNGELIREISLDDISEPIEFDISDDDGHINTIRAEQGRICMLRADCPDKVCVEQGWIDNGVLPVVCLPNKVTIEITGDDGVPETPVERTVFAMDTAVSLTAYGQNAAKVVEEAENEIHRLDTMMSRADENGDIYPLNANGSGIVNDETAFVIHTAIDIGRSTDGAFDITIAPVMDLWGFFGHSCRVPDAAELETELEKVDYNNIEIHGNNVSLKNGAAIDLGGIAKGYTGDSVTRIFSDNGIESGLISFGSAIQAIGTRPDGSDWRIGIADPQNSNDNIARIGLSDKCIVTSGSYEQSFEENGQKYHHIIDPADGYPADRGLASVSIISDSAVTGGECYAVQFAEMGIATYCYDLRLASENSRSDNDTLQLSPLTVQSDLQAVIDTSKTWDFVDTDNVFLMGYSLGGLTSAITAPENMDYVKAEILFYPAFVVQDAAAEFAAMGDDMPETFDLTGVTLGRPFVEDTVNYDLYAQAERFTKDVLLIHGDADPVVPISYSERLRELLSSVEYHVIKDGVHSFQDAHFVEAMTYVKDFLYREINNTRDVVTLQIGNSTMYVNGAAVSVDENGIAPRIINDRTLLPLRSVIESLGGSIEWNDTDKSVTVSHNENTVIFTIGSNNVSINGQVQTMDSAPQVIEDRTLLPLRAAAETLGMRVEWSEPTQTITVIN